MIMKDNFAQARVMPEIENEAAENPLPHFIEWMFCNGVKENRHKV